MRPLDLLSALVLDSGALWGETATDWQRADAAALLDHGPDAPRLHFLTRPRGGSKTTDLAAVALAALVTQAPTRSTSHAFARDRDQAALLLDALGGLVARTGLGGLVDIGSWSVTVRETGARLAVESADAASAYGHLPFLVIADELAQWPTTRGARALWEALVSGLPKRSDSRLAVLTTAGDPAHWSAKVLDAARTSDRWRVSEVRGPLPWADPDDLAEQARLLPASAYARLHLNRWTAAEDRLTSAEDLAACVTLDGPQPHDPRHRYVIGLDLGLKNDRTVLAVCHAEHTSGPPLVVLDRMHVLAGSRERAVSLADIEAVAHEAATTYGAPIRLDPWQAVGLAQRLRARGVAVTEWTFSPVSVGRLAMTLHLLLREHRLALPDDSGLLDELAAVRLRETRPGVYRLDHDAGEHDDRAVALGLAALALTDRAEGRGGITSPIALPRVARTLHDARPSLPTRLMVRAAAREQTPGQRRAGLGLLVLGSANGPERMTRRDRRG
ncbi:MAG: Phage terminase large subunit-like protein [Massilia sp.]|nr:Phage terminase large subunit-like protein [Massilia sp.]